MLIVRGSGFQVWVLLIVLGSHDLQEIDMIYLKKNMLFFFFFAKFELNPLYSVMYLCLMHLPACVQEGGRTAP